MPARPGTKASESKKKKKGFLSRYAGGSRKFIADRGREIEEITTGIPAGVHSILKATDQALPPGAIPFLERLALEKEGRHNDPSEIKKIGKQIAKQTVEDLRHPTRNPTATALTLLGVGSAGAGVITRAASGASAVSKTGKVGAGVRAAVGPQLAERSFTGIAKVPGQKARKYKNVPA